MSHLGQAKLSWAKARLRYFHSSLFLWKEMVHSGEENAKDEYTEESSYCD